MIRIFLLIIGLFAAVPSSAQQVVHTRDPYEKCEKVAENTRYGLVSLKCGKDHKPDDATWLITFDLGRWSAPYSRFTILGGRELEIVGVPRASISSCRTACIFYQVESIKIPFDVLFSEEALGSGLSIKGVGGPSDVFLQLPAARIQAFRRGLISAGFIEDDGNPGAWEREFKWPTPKQEAGELPRGG